MSNQHITGDLLVDGIVKASDLSLLVKKYVVETPSNQIDLYDLDIVKDGGIYDIFIQGSTDSHQWVLMNDVYISQATTATYSNIYTEVQDYIVGTMSNVRSTIHITLYIGDLSLSDRNYVEYKSHSVGTSSHHAVTGSGAYHGNGKHLVFRLNNGKLFSTGTIVKVYKRT